MAAHRGTRIANSTFSPTQNTSNTTNSKYNSGERRQVTYGVNVNTYHELRHANSPHLTPNGTSNTGHVRPNESRQPARHPEYADISRRQLSFSTWPPEAYQDTKSLCNLGFYYTGKGDLVCCYQCGYALKNFCEKDDPLTEHVRYSERCPFLLELLEYEKLGELKEELTSQIKGHAYQQERQTTRPNNPPVASGHLSAASPSHSTTATKQQTTKNTEEYRHPEYRQVEVRFSSFTKWPSTILQTPQQLADAGFYYTGMLDKVRCWACDGCLQKWDPEDDPWFEHCKWYPTCPFARQQKGEAYVALVQHDVATEIQKSTITTQKQQRTTEKTGYSHPEYRQVQVRILSFAKWPSTVLQTPQQLAEAGFYYTGVRDVVQCWSCGKCLQEWEPEDDPWFEHCKWFPTCPFARQEKGETYVALAQLAAATENQTH